jgi:hypothetical protein
VVGSDLGALSAEHGEDSSSSPAKIVGDRYELRRELGHGGVAAVHEAFDRVSGQRVALKRVLAKYMGTERPTATCFS